MCPMNGGGRKKQEKSTGMRNPWHSEEGTSDEGSGSEEDKKTEEWEKAVERALEEWEVMEGKGKVRSDVIEKQRGRACENAWCLTLEQVAHTSRPCGKHWRRNGMKE